MGENVNKEVENVDSALKAGADDGGEHGLGASAEPSTVAAPNLAIDDGGPDGLFPAIVGGIHAGMPKVSKGFL